MHLLSLSASKIGSPNKFDGDQMSALAVLEKFYRAVYNACDKKSKYPLKFSKQKPPIMSVGDRLSGVALYFTQCRGLMCRHPRQKDV